jgi:beta-N-acetylhexosaminidase
MDTHVVSARVDLSAAALARTHLVPFEAAVREGVEMIMPGHLAVPAISGSDTLPVTFSRGALTTYLRNTMGFHGVVITDSMQMAAARQEPFAIACVRAIKAGADVLLLPGEAPSPESAHEALLASLASHDPDALRMEEVDAAVRRIVRLKKRLHASFSTEGWVVDEAQAIRTVRTAATLDLARRAAARGLTWLKPLNTVARQRLAASTNLLVVSPVVRPHPDEGDQDRRGDFFGEPLARSRADRATVVIDLPFQRGRQPVSDLEPALLARLRGEAGRADGIVAGVARPEHLAALQTIQEAAGRDVPIVVVIFGSPYVVMALREPVTAILATFSVQRDAFSLAAAALGGTIPVTGRSPVDLTDRR